MQPLLAGLAVRAQRRAREQPQPTAQPSPQHNTPPKPHPRRPACSQVDPKFVYYLSAEFLMGRSLLNALYNLSLRDKYADAIAELGYDLETTVQAERDASLGNGGLGRLAACFLDSMATLSLPGWGYGIRYRYGMFKQGLDSELKQQELPDVWLTNGALPSAPFNTFALVTAEPPASTQSVLEHDDAHVRCKCTWEVSPSVTLAAAQATRGNWRGRCTTPSPLAAPSRRPAGRPASSCRRAPTARSTSWERCSLHRMFCR